ncbi:MAG: hypothetical protein U1E48_06170 [Paracoccaceae bacterium]
MTKLNTLILAAIIGFSALPALADTGSFSLPRLDFPNRPAATRAIGGDPAPVAMPVAR